MSSFPIAKAQSASEAATPPMGWNSWNHFGDKVNDANVRATADAMAVSYTHLDVYKRQPALRRKRKQVLLLDSQWQALVLPGTRRTG